MGDIRRQRKKYSKPSKPWEKERILSEALVIKEYGFKNKKELWKMQSLLKDFKERAKEFVRGNEDDLKKATELIQKLFSLGLVEADAKIDDVLGLNIKQLLDRRLQTIVYKKSLALSVKQARQLIVHGAILVGDRALTSPSYLVKRDEEKLVRINPNSKFANPDHPEVVKIKNKLLKLEEESKKEELEKVKTEKTDKSTQDNKKKETKGENKKTEKTEAKAKEKKEGTPKKAQPNKVKESKEKEQKSEEVQNE